MFELYALHRVLGIDFNVSYDLPFLCDNCFHCFCVIQSKPLCSIVVLGQHRLNANFARLHTEILSQKSESNSVVTPKIKSSQEVLTRLKTGNCIRAHSDGSKILYSNFLSLCFLNYCHQLKAQVTNC